MTLKFFISLSAIASLTACIDGPVLTQLDVASYLEHRDDRDIVMTHICHDGRTINAAPEIGPDNTLCFTHYSFDTGETQSECVQQGEVEMIVITKMRPHLAFTAQPDRGPGCQL